MGLSQVTSQFNTILHKNTVANTLELLTVELNGLNCRYSIDRHTDVDRVFGVYAGNGSIFLQRPLDREEFAWHNISVIATEFSK